MIVCLLPSFYIKYISLGPREIIQCVKALATLILDDQKTHRKPVVTHTPVVPAFLQ